MILDTMEHACQYERTIPGLGEMLKAQREYPAEPYRTGRVELDGERMFMNVSEYATRPMSEQVQMEAHRRYVDVMYMVEGEEIIYVFPTERLEAVEKAYCEADDVLLARFQKEATPVHLQAGQFVVLFPQDAHAPSCQYAGETRVKKIIGKLEYKTEA